MEKAIVRTLLLGLILTSTSLFAQDTFDYTGQVRYQSNDNPMSNVSVNLKTLDGTLLQTTTTNSMGYYTFDSIALGIYVLSFSTDEVAGGVELSDAYLIEQYHAGNYPFTDIQYKAADVNGDGFVTDADRQQIIDEYLNEGNPFPVGEWVFENDTVNILGCGGDGDVNLGSSSGDVNGSLQPDPKRNHIDVEHPAKSICRNASGQIIFDLTSNDILEVAGLHLVFRIPDELNYVGVESPIQGIKPFYKDGLLKITWMDTDREFKLTQGEVLISVITEENTPLQEERTYNIVLHDDSHLMDVHGKLISGVSMSLPAINVTSQQEISQKAYPNPFTNYFTIEYVLPGNGQVSTILTDQSGRQVYSTGAIYQDAGANLSKIDGTSLSPGLYFYQVRHNIPGQQMITGTIFKSK